MESNVPYISRNPKPKWIVVVERVFMVILLVLACLPVITIPFVLFSLEKDRADKATRERWNVIYMAILATCAAFCIIFSMVMFLSAYSPTQPTIDAIPLVLWDEIEGNVPVLVASLACTMMSHIAINRLATNILHHEEGEARLNQVNGFAKWLSVFKWKNARNGLTSGNETLWKVKTAAAWAALSSLALIVLTPAILGSRLMNVIEAIVKMEQHLFEALSVEDYVISAMYVVFAGGLFIASAMVTWFYMGRAFSYQAQHDIKRGSTKAWWMRVAGYVISAQSFLPLAITFLGGTPFLGLVVTTVVIGLAIACWLVVIRRFSNDQANLVLDPKVLQAKHVEPSRRVYNDPVKRACFGFLVVAVVGLSAITAAIWFPATAAYASLVEPHEWLFYAFLGAAITGGPIVLLLFLRSVYARRALMVYLASVVLVLIVECVTVSPFSVEITQVFHAIVFGNRAGYTSYSGSLSTTDRPLQVLLVVLYVGAAAAAFMVVKRKAIPIEVTTPKHSFFSSWRNLRAFLFTNTRRRATRGNVAMLAFLAVTAGMLITFQPPETIVLHRDPANTMRVSFWSYTLSLPNSTLQILGDNHARLFGPSGNANDASNRENAARYGAFGVELVPTIHMPYSARELSDCITYADASIDSWLLYGLDNGPYIGFVFDMEDMNGLRYYNATLVQAAIDATRQLQEHLESRGFGLFLTEYMLTIGDLLDGDLDLANNNRDAIDFTWNLTQFDWMLYRAERAINYNEPHAMFTYEWARFMKSAITRIGGDALFKKTSFSIGVTTTEMPLYRGPGGLGELMQDVKICQAMGIPAINIFHLGRPGHDGFLGLWGNEGLARLYDEAGSFGSVAFTFERRATFFGNLKGMENPTGSVFGFFFQDAWLDEWVGYLVVPWIAVMVVAPLLSLLKGRFGPPAPRPATKRAYSNNWVDRCLILARVALYAMLWLLVAWMGITLFNPTFF